MACHPGTLPGNSAGQFGTSTDSLRGEWLGRFSGTAMDKNSAWLGVTVV